MHHQHGSIRAILAVSLRGRVPCQGVRFLLAADPLANLKLVMDSFRILRSSHGEIGICAKKLFCLIGIRRLAINHPYLQTSPIPSRAHLPEAVRHPALLCPDQC